MWDLRERKPQQQVIEKFDALFQKGAIIETFDDEVLETAILYQANEVAKFLLTKGADPNGFRSHGKPLKIATRFGKHEAITILMQHGAKPLKPEEAAQLRLTFAAGTGKLNAIKTELANGAGIDSRDTLDHETALVEAAQWGHTEAVKLLLQVGAYPKQAGYLSAVDLFGSYQAREPLNSRGMCTALHAATIHGGFPEIVRLLLKASVPVSSSDCRKNLTPLRLAAKFNSISTATVLLQAGAKVMSKDSDGKTPLDHTERGPMIKLLKGHGARELP